MQSTISFKGKLIIHDYRHGIKILQYSTVVNQDRHQCTGTVDYMQLQGGPIKTAHFLRYHIFAATTDIIMQFLLKCSEITAENNKRQFF